ncbi:alpha/beta fold hydrolase [Sphingomonas sp. CGMCC 1.13654]|uniref:Alpha/beta fold hydrolase n=1 Tax=Sphingomonas chungangi TaxID=2683589 RepID=A0A838L6Z9_9SPHN|nr:alpha/beta fold hydrolase [Sphingomonas chungangi]MBA2934817.1 alpha/beta fold hydrolase [Sphingomonas chungangi]MVW58128.1 alpha/beta fold hydrolase [Sphingomonas chungangi]
MTLVNLPSGETIWYKTTGTGAPLLQIHGSAFGHRNFEKLTPLMAPHFECIDFDLPGYGESKGLPQSSMAGIAEQVYGFLRAAGYDKVSIHGTSFGAMIGMTLAALHPEIVDKLVLSCFLTRYDNAARMMRSTWKRTAKDSGMEAVADLTSVAGFARGFYDLPHAQAQLQSMRDAFAKNTPEAFIAGTETIERTDLSEYIDRVKAPTLLIAGAEDNMTPFKPADSGVGFHHIKDRIPGAELTVLPDCGHYLVIEQPELCAEKVVEFVNR